MEIVIAGGNNLLTQIPYYNLEGGEMLVFENLGQSSSYVSQNPSGLGDGNKIQVHYGGTFGDANSPIQLLDEAGVGDSGGPGSIIRINEAGAYVFEFASAFGRTGSAGVSEIWFRLTVGGFQSGDSVDVKLEDSEVRSPQNIAFHAEFPADIDLRVEILRASGSNNSGGILAAISPDGWNSASSANFTVGRFILPL